MKARWQITGLGPKKPDGSMFIFTTLTQPHVATAEWLAAQPKHPECGDWLEFSVNGEVTLAPAYDVKIDSAESEVDDTQKKSVGTDESGSGQEPSPFKLYKARPVVISAAEITKVVETADGEFGEYECTFSDGTEKVATHEMAVTFIPKVGDYWAEATLVGQDYESILPKALFEESYELVEE